MASLNFQHYTVISCKKFKKLYFILIAKIIDRQLQFYNLDNNCLLSIFIYDKLHIKAVERVKVPYNEMALQSMTFQQRMPCPFAGPKMLCAGLNILCQPKNLTSFSASSKTFVLAQKPILLNATHLFVWHKMFATATIYKSIFGLTQTNWTSTKHFGTCKSTRHKCN